MAFWEYRQFGEVDQLTGDMVVWIEAKSANDANKIAKDLGYLSRGAVDGKADYETADDIRVYDTMETDDGPSVLVERHPEHMCAEGRLYHPLRPDLTVAILFADGRIVRYHPSGLTTSVYAKKVNAA